ncbi:MAG: hypothetical protein WA431_08770 [Candidatus Cybelea sp.]
MFRLRNAEREACGLSGDLAELEFVADNAERALEIVDEALPVAGYLLRLGDFTEAEATARDAVALALKTHRRTGFSRARASNSSRR